MHILVSVSCLAWPIIVYPIQGKGWEVLGAGVGCIMQVIADHILCTQQRQRRSKIVVRVTYGFQEINKVLLLWLKLGRITLLDAF